MENVPDHGRGTKTTWSLWSFPFQSKPFYSMILLYDLLNGDGPALNSSSKFVLFCCQDSKAHKYVDDEKGTYSFTKKVIPTSNGSFLGSI